MMSIAMTLRPSPWPRPDEAGGLRVDLARERRAGAAAEQMITLFQRLADGELSLKSGRDPDADCGVGGIGGGNTDARSFGVGASVSGVPPPSNAGNRIAPPGTPPTLNILGCFMNHQEITI